MSKLRRLIVATLAMLACGGLGPCPRRILAVGDSITGGGLLTSIVTWPSVFAELLGHGAQVHNEAHSGFTVADMAAAYASGPRGSFRECFFMGGVNDIRGGAPGAETYAAAMQLLNAMRADGCRLHILRPTPFKYSGLWSQGAQAEMDAYWASLLGYCAEGGASCLDTWAFVSNGAGALNPALDSGDAIHPNQAGQDVLAVAVLQSLGH